MIEKLCQHKNFNSCFSLLEETTDLSILIYDVIIFTSTPKKKYLWNFWQALKDLVSTKSYKYLKTVHIIKSFPQKMRTPVNLQFNGYMFSKVLMLHHHCTKFQVSSISPSKNTTCRHYTPHTHTQRTLNSQLIIGLSIVITFV